MHFFLLTSTTRRDRRETFPSLISCTIPSRFTLGNLRASLNIFIYNILTFTRDVGMLVHLENLLTLLISQFLFKDKGETGEESKYTTFSHSHETLEKKRELSHTPHTRFYKIKVKPTKTHMQYSHIHTGRCSNACPPGEPSPIFLIFDLLLSICP